jgi:hypothetical protein
MSFPWRTFLPVSLSRVRPNNPVPKKTRTATKEKLMKRLLFTTGLFAVLACALNAQTTTGRATIPFDFQIGKSHLPAGKYVIQESGCLLTVRDVNGTSAVNHLTRPASGAPLSRDPHLEFHRYGDVYFLAGVWNSSSRDGHALPKSKQEKELAAGPRSVQTAKVDFPRN